MTKKKILIINIKKYYILLINKINTFKRFRRFVCKKPIQLQRRSTAAAFIQIPNNLQATNPNSFVDDLA